MGRLDEYDFESELDKRVVSMYVNERLNSTITKELKLKNQKLYDILDKYEVPRKQQKENKEEFNNLTKIEKEKIKKMYLDSDNSIDFIRKENKISNNTLYYVIEYYDLTKRLEEFNLKKENEDEFKKMFLNEDVTLKEICDRFSIPSKKISFIAYKLELPNRRGLQKLDKLNEMKRLFLETRLEVSEIVKKTNSYYELFYKAVEIFPPEKVEFRKKFKGLSKQELKEIRFLYYAGGTTVERKDICDHYDITPNVFAGILKKLNLPLQSELKKEWVGKLRYKDGLKVTEIAKKINLTDSTVYRILRKIDKKTFKINHPGLIMGVEKFGYGDELIQQTINKDHVTGGNIMNKENVVEEDTIKKEIEDMYLKEYQKVEKIAENVGKPYDEVNEIIKSIPEYKKEYRRKYRGLRPEDLRKLIYRHYQKHAKLREITKEFGHSEGTLRHILEELGLPSQRDFNIERIKKLTLEGLNIFEITKEVSFQEITVGKYMKETTNDYTPKYVDLMEQVTDIDNIKIPMPTPEGGEKMVAPDPEPEEVNEIKGVKEDLTPEKKFFGDELLITGDFTIRTSVSEDKYSGSLKIIIE